MQQTGMDGIAERVLGMAAIAACIEQHTGHKPGRSTLWRWHLSGRLAARRIGGRLYATESAIRAMLTADEERNRGSAGTRGLAAAKRIEAIRERAPRAKGGRR